MKKMCTVAGDGVRNPCDVVRTSKRRRQDFLTTSELNRLKEALEDSAKRRRQDYKMYMLRTNLKKEKGMSEITNSTVDVADYVVVVIAADNDCRSSTF
ncbi:hypothetical protein Tco_0682929 [Tanacetum coccineum]|uniref:Uncharacterized protein n=1 Tax=Tanacetum coccineum TaxID=301880 RepID=A0ABQ4XSK4_9ASTR